MTVRPDITKECLSMETLWLFRNQMAKDLKKVVQTDGLTVDKVEMKGFPKTKVTLQISGPKVRVEDFMESVAYSIDAGYVNVG